LKTTLKTGELVRTAVFAALLCAAAPISVPVGPVPISMATLIIYVAAGVLGRGRAALAVSVYILLGAMGMPVFAGFSGGISKLVGVTGGYIAGYIPLALIAGSFPAVSGRRFLIYPAGLLAGTAALYALGTAWFVVSTGNTLPSALAVCVVPFLPGDALKIAAAVVAAPVLRRALGRLSA
jgi:biotin transport system substrate-specific component